MIEILSTISVWNLATGFIIAMLIVDRFTNFLDKIGKVLPTNGNNNNAARTMSLKDLEDRQRRDNDIARHVWHTDEGNEVLRKTRTLYDWHNREDEDGVKIWYVRRDLTASITNLAANIDRQTRVLERILDRDMP